MVFFCVVFGRWRIDFGPTRIRFMKKTHLESPTESSLRETKVILLAWIVLCGWTLAWTATRGYWTEENSQLTAVPTVLGMPSWVAWGIAFPWIISTAFTTWFCLAYMRDDDFDEHPDDLAAGDKHE